jgi:hypothetical protein
MTRKAKYKEEDGYLSISPSPPQTSSTGTLHPLLHGKASGSD